MGERTPEVRVIDEARDFEEQLHTHGLAALRLARYLGANPDDAADVVQDAAVQAWRYRRTLRGEWRPWFMTIVRRVASRSRRRWTLIPFSWQPSDEGVEVTSLGTSPVAMAMAHLPRKQRAAVWLRFGEDLAYRDVGRILGIREGAAKMLVARGRVELKKQMQTQAQERIG